MPEPIDEERISVRDPATGSLLFKVDWVRGIIEVKTKKRGAWNTSEVRVAEILAMIEARRRRAERKQDSGG